MIKKQFESVIKNQIDLCLEMLSIKQREYSNKRLDLLDVFKRAGTIQHKSTREALAGMMVKHTLSIYDMCQNGDFPLELWEEKITDHINYLLILRAIIAEEYQPKLSTYKSLRNLELEKDNYDAARYYEEFIPEDNNKTK